MSLLNHFENLLDPKNHAGAKPPANDSATRSVTMASQVHLTIHYRQVGSTIELREPTVLAGAVGDHVTIPWVVIPGYVLTEITGFTAFFPAESGPVYCEYSPQIAGPVIVYHRDTQGRLLEPPEVLTGDINADFEAYALADNVDQVVGDAVQTGQFTGHSQTIRFTYQLNALEAGTPPDQTEYIEVLVPKSVYLDPTATSPLADVLPAHTFWRVYTLMRETVTNQVWLNLGGSQWITADQTQRRHTMAFLHGPDQLALPSLHFAQTNTPMRAVGIATGGSDGVTLWSAPYGHINGTRLGSGSRLKITSKADLDDGSSWYQLKSGDYVMAQYVEL